MESTFVWILMFAGAAVVLLGIFLVASERELKKKRGEIEGLVARLEGQTADGHTAESFQTDSSASPDLLARNRELEMEVKALSADLAQTQRTITEMESTQAESAQMQLKIRQLTGAHEELSRETEELRRRLETSETDLQNARRDDSGAALSRMQAEIDELRLALENSNAQVTELEAARKNLPDLTAIAAERESERQDFQRQIAEMQKQLSEQQRELAETQALRERIEHSESSQQALRAEISRYQEEIPQWEARLAAAQEAASRLGAIQAPYYELLSRHAELADQQRQLHEELAALAGKIVAPTGLAGDMHADVSSAANQFDASKSASSSAAPKLVPFQENSSATGIAPQEATGAAPTDPRAHRFGILCALLFFGAMGVVGVQFLGSEWEPTAVETATAKSPEPVVPPAASASIRAERVATKIENATPADRTQAVAISARPPEPTASRPEITLPPAAAPTGTYRVIHPSRVYAAPQESSRPLGDIEPGVNVNVVSAREGWFEIHSKHGRPPGFIRREVVARVGGAN
jgi:hypothetical protein